LGKSSPCSPYFPTFSAEPKRWENLRFALPISLHLVLTLKVGKFEVSFMKHFPTSVFPYN